MVCKETFIDPLLKVVWHFTRACQLLEINHFSLSCYLFQLQLLGWVLSLHGFFNIWYFFSHIRVQNIVLAQNMPGFFIFLNVIYCFKKSFILWNFRRVLLLNDWNILILWTDWALNFTMILVHPVYAPLTVWVWTCFKHLWVILRNLFIKGFLTQFTLHLNINDYNIIMLKRIKDRFTTETHDIEKVN